jgi:hypothetical protein
MAVRMVAGPVGWAALGVSAGLVLAQMYYSQPDLAAIKQAASPPTGNWTYSYNGQTYTIPNHNIAGSPLTGTGLPWWAHVRLPGQSDAGHDLGRALQLVVSAFAHTSPVGTTGTTQPADNTVSHPVSPTEMPTTVKPKPVPCRRYRGGGQRSASGQYPAAEYATADDDHDDDDNDAESGRLDDATGRDPGDHLLCRRIS